MSRKIFITLFLVLLINSNVYSQRQRGTRASNVNAVTFSLIDTTGTRALFGSFSYIMVDSTGTGWLFNNVDSLWTKIDLDSAQVLNLVGKAISDSIDTILGQTISDTVANQISFLFPDSLRENYFVIRDSVQDDIQAAIDTFSVDSTNASFKADSLTGDIRIDQVINLQDTLLNISESLSASSVKYDSVGSPIFSNSQRIHDAVHSSGWVFGGEITILHDSVLTVTGGQGFIHDQDSTLTTLFPFVWTSDSVTVTLSEWNFISIDFNVGNPIVVISNVNPAEGGMLGIEEDKVLLGAVFRDDLHPVYIVESVKHTVANHAGLTVKRFKDTAPMLTASGGVVTDATGLKFSVSNAIIWNGLTEFSTPTFTSSPVDTFFQYYRDGIGGWISRSDSLIDNLQFDDGSGTLAAITNNHYGNHWVYLIGDGSFHVVYGRGSFTLTEAESEIEFIDLPPVLEEKTTRKLLAKIIILENAIIFTQVRNVSQSVISVSSGINVLSDLADVNITSPINLQTLQFNGADWINITSSGSIGNADSLGNIPAGEYVSDIKAAGVTAALDNLVAYYSFDFNSIDYVNGFDGFVTSATKIDSGLISGAYFFDGVDDFISIDNLLLNELITTTSGVWNVSIKPFDATPASIEEIITFNDLNGPSFIALRLLIDGKIGGLYVDATTTTQWQFSTDNIVAFDNTKMNIIFIQDGTSPSISINGKLEPITFSVSTDLTKWFNGLTLLDKARIGDSNSNLAGEAGFFNGVIDEVSFYSSSTPNINTNQLFVDSKYFNSKNTHTDLSDFRNITTIETVPNDSLTDYYPFDFNADSYGNARNDGIVSGATQIDTGFVSGAFVFDGVDDFINIDGALTPLANTTTGTWEVWVKPVDATPSVLGGIIAFGDANAISFLSIDIATDGILRAISRSVTLQWNLNTDSPVFIDNAWTYVTIVQDGISPIIYVNAIIVAQTFVSTIDITAWFSSISGLDNGRIGGRNNSSGGEMQFFDGQIDEVKFRKTALTAEQIRQNYLDSKHFNAKNTQVDLNADQTIGGVNTFSDTTHFNEDVIITKSMIIGSSILPPSTTLLELRQLSGNSIFELTGSGASNGGAVQFNHSGGTPAGQLSVFATDTFFDYAGTLNWRSGFNGAVAMSLGADSTIGFNGDISVFGQLLPNLDINFANWSAAPDFGLGADNVQDTIQVRVVPDSINGGLFSSIVGEEPDTSSQIQFIDVFSPILEVPFQFVGVDSIVFDFKTGVPDVDSSSVKVDVFAISELGVLTFQDSTTQLVSSTFAHDATLSTFTNIGRYSKLKIKIELRSLFLSANGIVGRMKIYWKEGS